MVDGGTDRLENLQLLCAHCNHAKGSRSQENLSDYLRKIGVIA
ncbi:MAG: HNH endonuclease [Chloroflexota bacterium]|nr:HNH endonuclease [Chloroflexota bacterium]